MQPCCAECKQFCLVDDVKNGCMTCTHCGLVADERMMVEQDWTADENTKVQTSRTQQMPQKLARIARWGQTKPETWVAELQLVCDRCLALSTGTTKLAREIYEDVKERKGASLRGNFKRAVMACCAISAGKITGCKRSQKEVCDAFDITTRTLTSAIKMLRSELVGKKYYKQAFKCLDPRDIIGMHYATGIDRRSRSRILREATTLQDKINRSGRFQGRSPATIAAGILKILMLDKMDFEEVSRACSTSVSTAEAIYQELLQVLPDLSA